MNAVSLYSLTDDLVRLLDSDEDVTAELDALLPALESKAGAVAHYVQHYQDMVELLKAREKALAEYRKSLENRTARHLAYLKNCMEKADILKLTDSRTGTEIALKKNPPKVVVDDQSEIPNEYWRVPDPPPPAPDLKAIGEKLKRNEDVPGCHLEQGWRVEIRG